MKTVSGTAKKDKKAGTGIDTSALFPRTINGKSTKDLENTIKTLAIRKPETLTEDEKLLLPLLNTKKQSLAKEQSYNANDKMEFFQKGTFEDGYQFGDVTKSTLGTVADAGVGIIKGAGSLVEGLTDLGQYAVAGVADLVGADNYADKVKKNAKKSKVQSLFKPVDDYLDKYSVLGNTSDAIAQGIGQVGTIVLTGGLGGAAGLGTLGTTALTSGLTGLSSMGSGMSEAYQNDATDGEAWAYGATKGIVDAGTEMIFGGLGKAVNAVGLSKGISSLDDAFARKLSSKISNQAAKNLVQFGVKSSAEGVEEVLAGLGNVAAKKLTYMSEEDLGKLIKDERLLEQFVVSTVTSGLMQSGIVPGTLKGSLRDSNKQGRDFILDATENTQLPFVKEALQNQANHQVDNGEDLLPFVEVPQNKTKAVNQSLDALAPQDTSENLVENTVSMGNIQNSVSNVDNSSDVLVGRATRIKSPYSGVKPKQFKTEFPRVLISKESYDNAVTSINTAEIDKQLHSASGIKSVLQKVYEALFGDTGEAFHIPVEGMIFEGDPYIVDVNKSSVGKLVSTGPISVEKMCVLSDIDNVLANSEYVGSANYDNHNNKNSGVIRYDYFETPIRLNDSDYVVTFDVEVQKGTNKYRTHRVINEMNLTEATGEVENPAAPEVHANDVNTVQKTGASKGLFGSSNNSIPNSIENVNMAAENNASNQMQTVSEQSAQQGDTERGYNETFTKKTDAPQELKDEFINNPRMYNRLHNADTKAKADAILQGNDTNTAVNEYYTLLNQKDPAAVPLGYNLSKQLLNEGRKNEAVRVIEDMSKALTESGQFSQAAAITMLNNDPDAAMIMLMRKVDSMNEAGREKFGKKWKDFELKPEEQQMFEGIEVGDAEAIEAAYQQVYDRISREYPATMKDKLMEYRRVAMLLNVRTNVRNVASNALMLPVRWTGDRAAALGEGVYKLLKPDYERTQSLNPFRDKQTRELASKAWEQVKETILDGSNKYEDTKDAIRNKQVFKGSKVSKVIDNITNGAITKANKAMGKNNDPSLLETARNFTYWLLEQGDNIFVRANFKSRMMSYIDAQHINSVENIPADAYVLATQEAMKATFKDDTRLSKVLSEIKRSTGIVGEVVLPFTKTPANLAMRGMDYSPAGLAEAGYKLKNAQNHAEVAEAMTLFGQSATGSAAILLGMVLAEAGLISGALSEDKDEAAFQKQQGMLPYAIKVGDNYYSYDWAQPASIPLILGATIQQSQEDSDSFWHGLGQGTIAAADSWLELSPLQNLSDIFGGYGTPAQNVADVLMQFPLSFIPAQLGAATRIGDTAQRTTFDNTSSMENIKNQAMAKVPGLSELLPLSYDTWGNPINRQDSAGEAAFANLFNPGQFGNSNVTPLDGEVTRLFGATGDNRVFPKRADWSPDVSGEDVLLNNEQYSEYQRIMGENAYDMVSKLMKSSSYGSMDDTQRVAVIGNIYNFANALAKGEMLGYDITNANNYKKAYKIYKEKGAEGVAQYYAFKSLLDSDSEEKDYYSLINQSQLSNEDKGYYMRCLDSANNKTKVDLVASDKGDNGVYMYYTIKNLRTGENTIETIKAIDKLDLSEEDKGYYIEKFVSSESEKPKQIYEVYGYSGLYNWYKLKIAADAYGNNNGELDDGKTAFGKAVKSSNLPFVDQAVYMQIYGSK